MSRFSEPIKREGLNFDYDLYDAVLLNDGRKALITGYGIYDNQYWCEVNYPNGVYLDTADYFSSNSDSYGVKIIQKLSEKERQNIILNYITAVNKYSELYTDHIDFMKKLINVA